MSNYTLPPKVRREVWLSSGGRCRYCGRVCKLEWDFAVDHIVPRSAGGTDDIENLAPACRACNLMRRDLSIDDFRVKISRHLDRRPAFTTEQAKWLESRGVTIPESALVTFWFELPDEMGYSDLGVET